MIEGSCAHARTEDEAEAAELLIALMKAGRAVVSEHQALINDASKSHKGFTDEFAGRAVVEKFKAKTRVDLSRPNGIPQGGLLLARLQSERKVMLDAQPVIDKQGVGFKGVTPSLFARKPGESFIRKQELL